MFRLFECDMAMAVLVGLMKDAIIIYEDDKCFIAFGKHVLCTSWCSCRSLFVWWLDGSLAVSVMGDRQLKRHMRKSPLISSMMMSPILSKTISLVSIITKTTFSSVSNHKECKIPIPLCNFLCRKTFGEFIHDPNVICDMPKSHVMSWSWCVIWMVARYSEDYLGEYRWFIFVWWGVEGSHLPTRKRVVCEVRDGTVSRSIFYLDGAIFIFSHRPKSKTPSNIDDTTPPNHDISINTPPPTASSLHRTTPSQHGPPLIEKFYQGWFRGCCAPHPNVQ